MENPVKKSGVFKPPVQALGMTPEQAAAEVWLGMDKRTQRRFERIYQKSAKVKGLGAVGFLELVLALTASGALDNPPSR